MPKIRTRMGTRMGMGTAGSIWTWMQGRERRIDYRY